MKLRLILILVAFLSVYQTQAQLSEGSVLVSGTLGNRSFASPGGTASYGADIQVFASNRFALNYRLLINNERVHLPASLPLALTLTIYSLYYDVDALWLALIPEGVGYYIPVRDGLYFAPYLNPLGFEWRYTESDFWYMTTAAGARATAFVGDRLVIAPFAEYQHNYGTFGSGVHTGVSVGFHFY